MATVERTTDRVLHQLEHDLQLSADELAGALGGPVRTLEGWRLGEIVPGTADRTRLGELEALHRHLCRTLMPEGVPLWLRATSRYLAGATPVDMLRGGQIERVEAALEALDSGFFV